ncbi:MAG: hypothetical protein GY913_34485 [Proteobacteria bacterium]|nr:hypothetical protein [Pseudomonadota bacterium]MCP4922038.1 hypothetical protein [Pseudomonadota bacterium]
MAEAQRTARRAEATTHTTTIQDTVEVYAESTEDHVALNTGLNPSPSPAHAGVDGTQGRRWNEGVDTEGRIAWATLGWQPDGELLCSYSAHAAGKWDRNDWWVLAECDTDGDGQPYQLLKLGPTLQDQADTRVRVEPFSDSW